MPSDPTSGRRGPPPPFDLEGLNRVIDKNARRPPDPNRKWWTPWRRHDRSQTPPQLLRDSRPTATRAILALAPGPDLAEAIRVALAPTKAPRGVGPRIVLRAELALADTEIWQPVITEVARRRQPFTVRIVQAEIVRDRMLGLVAGGQVVHELHAAIEDALGGGRAP